MATIEAIKAQPSSESVPDIWFSTADSLPKLEQEVLVRTVAPTGQACEGVAHLCEEHDTGTMLWYSWLGESCLKSVTAWHYLPTESGQADTEQPVEEERETTAVKEAEGGAKGELNVAQAEMEHWIEESRKAGAMFLEAVGQHDKWVSVKERLPESSQRTKEFQTYCDGEFKRASWTHDLEKGDWLFWGLEESAEIEVSHWRPVQEEEDFEASNKTDGAHGATKLPQQHSAASV